jgi:hypothetical protein
MPSDAPHPQCRPQSTIAVLRADVHRLERVVEELTADNEKLETLYQQVKPTAPCSQVLPDTPPPGTSWNIRPTDKPLKQSTWDKHLFELASAHARNEKLELAVTDLESRLEVVLAKENERLIEHHRQNVGCGVDVWQDWMESKIQCAWLYLAHPRESNADTLIIDLPPIYIKIDKQNDTPDHIKFLLDCKEDGESSVFEICDCNYDWYVKEVEIISGVSDGGGDDTLKMDVTSFKVTMEKIITYECTVCGSEESKVSMLYGSHDTHICNDCHISFTPMP